MPNTLLYPMIVSAKVITAETAVPALHFANDENGDTDGAFNREAKLEPGIHVHWALPDGLTGSRIEQLNGSTSVLFPAIPDLWLVVRFNPGASSATPDALRSWAAWVVDSIKQNVTPLPQWTPPLDRDASQAHTLAGVLPSAAARGEPGWGVWDLAEQGGRSFHPAMAAYYPESRSRFGFYDSLEDLAGKTGTVSYLVVGWYWSDSQDPLSVSAHPSQLLQQWKVALDAPSDPGYVSPVVSRLKQEEPAWEVGVTMNPAPAPAQPAVETIRRATLRAGDASLLARNLDVMANQFPDPRLTLTQGASAWSMVAGLHIGVTAPKALICHGAVVGVPLAGADAPPTPLNDGNVKLYDNVKRAMADLAARGDLPDAADAVEMILANLESQKSSTGGIIDMAGAAHASTFQGVAGKAQYFARMAIELHPPAPARSSAFSNINSDILKARGAVGYWPAKVLSSGAMTLTAARIRALGGSPRPPSPQPNTPEPTEAEKQAWLDQVRAAFAQAQSDADGKGTPIDARLIRVEASGPPSASSSGNNKSGGAWWVNIDSDEDLVGVLVAAAGGSVTLPSAGDLYVIPGPRWYRPWSPQIVLRDVGRSYKFGFDGRFDPEGMVQCRITGEYAISMTVGKHGAVFGQQLVNHPEAIALPGVPTETIALVYETVLLDDESRAVMAKVAGGPEKDFTNAIQGLWLQRDPRLASNALTHIVVEGKMPSPIGLSPWTDPLDPIFVDSNYSHPHSPVDAWEIRASDVELRPVSPQATVPDEGPVEILTQRSLVTATETRVLQSAMIGRVTLDPTGRKVPVYKPNNVDANTFLRMNVFSAALTRFDSQLSERGYRLRSGALRLNHLDVVDIFGTVRSWDSGVSPDSPSGDPVWPYWVAMPPRLPYWSRFTLRLMAASDPETPADPLDGPVCGFLLPDFIDHGLDIFDGSGQGLGRLTTDKPIQGHTDGATLSVQYSPLPWLPSNPDPYFYIANPTLKSLVQSIAAQPMVVPAGEVTWAETGLSAMLRTIDTIRGTFDSSVRTSDRKVSLIGEPIVVMRAKLEFNGTDAADPSTLTKDPALLTDPPALPAIPVRIGDATRPDDTVLGLFFAGPTPDAGHFAPVTTEAAEKAIVNGLTTLNSSGWIPVEHPFVKGQETLVSLPANQPMDLVILSDPRGSIYATCGALPRKTISMPKSFIDSAIKDLEPAFYTGPVLTTLQSDSEKTLLPPPDLAGYRAEFLYQKVETGEWSHSDVPASPPLSELPKDRVVLTEGWVRMTRT